MFSVLIVDDEEPVLESYEFMLNSFYDNERKKNPFTVIGKARTGFEALRMIQELEPDIVFMDINIPGMDGISVLENVYKKHPRMISILSTAYERFDIARRAISLGIFAYLIKPVSKKSFFATLENVLIELRSLLPENSKYSEPRLALLCRDIWTVMDEQCWSWYRETLSLPSDYGFTFLVEMKEDIEIWSERIAEMLSYKHHCTFAVMLNRCLFLICEDGNPAMFRNKTIKGIEALLGNVIWHFGLGGCYRGPELYRSCSEALAELTDKQQGTDVWSGMSGKIAILRQKIGLLPLEETQSLFVSIWEPLFSRDFDTAKLRMVSFFTLLLDDIFGYWSASFHKNNGDVSPVMLFDPAAIIELPDLDAWKHWAERNFETLVYHASLKRQGNYPLPLIKALAYVQENYTRSIQLSDVAEKVLVNTAHLSRLFSEHLKTNFIDYLTALRINKAELLLKENVITVKETAFAVGYQDPNYFSKVFKKQKGILPTEVTGELRIKN